MDCELSIASVVLRAVRSRSTTASPGADISPLWRALARLCFPHGVDGATINTRARASDETHCIHTAQGTSRTTKNRATQHASDATFRIPRISGFYVSYTQDFRILHFLWPEPMVSHSRYPGYRGFAFPIPRIPGFYIAGRL